MVLDLPDHPCKANYEVERQVQNVFQNIVIHHESVVTSGVNVIGAADHRRMPVPYNWLQDIDLQRGCWASWQPYHWVCIDSYTTFDLGPSKGVWGLWRWIPWLPRCFRTSWSSTWSPTISIGRFEGNIEATAGGIQTCFWCMWGAIVVHVLEPAKRHREDPGTINALEKDPVEV